jgi:hypothetical protein
VSVTAKVWRPIVSLQVPSQVASGVPCLIISLTDSTTPAAKHINLNAKMDSPTDPGSPVSNSSADSPLEEMTISESVAATQDAALYSSQTASTAGPSSGKRRQPPGGFSAGPSSSAKARRKEEGLSKRPAGSQYLGERDGGRQKDELVDMALVERLRNGE